MPFYEDTEFEAECSCRGGHHSGKLAAANHAYYWKSHKGQPTEDRPVSRVPVRRAGSMSAAGPPPAAGREGRLTGLGAKMASGPMAHSSHSHGGPLFTTLADRIRGLASLFWREVAKFGAVGGVAFVIDNGLTYYLMHGPMTDSEAKARFVGASVATVFSWIANRLWTFRHRRQANVLREFLMFVLINGIGIGISTGFTALAKYGLGVTDKNMLFLAGVAGILVATVVRFFAYRFLVFNEELDQEPEFSHDHELIELHHHHKEHGSGAERAAERAPSTDGHAKP